MSGPVIYADLIQGSPEWHEAKVGLPSASRFADILAKGEGKTRRKYLYELAAERITGDPSENYSNAHMERGKAMEDEARDLYSMMRDVEPQRIGGIRNGNVWCSPDSLIGDKRGLEIKTALGHIQIERLLAGKLPPEHRAQVQGSLWVGERDEWDFMSYWPKMRPLIVRVHRDEDYIRDLEAAVAQFNEELAELVERLTGDSSARLKQALANSIHMAG